MKWSYYRTWLSNYNEERTIGIEDRTPPVSHINKTVQER